MPKLIYASTKNRDLFYALKIEVSDPIFFIETEMKKYVFLDYREIDFFKEKNKNPDIEAVLLNPLLEKAAKISHKITTNNKLVLSLIEKFVKEISAIGVPSDFPLDMADFLRTKGIAVSPKNPLYPERAIKTEEEISLMRETAKRTLNVFKKVEGILRDASIDGDHVKYRNELLTSEFLKKEAAVEMAKQELIDTEGVIISSGAHSAIPHHPGAGPIKAGEPIVCDIFPKSRISGYFSDITRTYVKGVPSKEISAMFDAVLRAQENAVSLLKAGVQAKEIHNSCEKTLLELGYHIGEKGFTHSAGHGVGLEVHESPSIGPNSEAILEPGNMITVEPGLYYPKVGGTRIEDMFLVTETGAVCLTEYPRKLIIE